LQIAFLAVLALLSQPNQREKTQNSFTKKQLNGYQPPSSTEIFATIESKMPKTTPLNKNTHRIKKETNTEREKTQMFFSSCGSFLIDNKAESLRFFCENLLGLKKFDDFVSRECEQEEESMNPCICLLTWPIGSKSQCARWWKQFNHKLTRGIHNCRCEDNRATCLVF
jgi:hypothetical protein